MARRTIHLEELDQFEVDDNNRLYWQDQRVVTEMEIKLPRLLEWLAGGAAIAVILGFCFGVADRLGAFPPAAQPPIEVTVSPPDLEAEQ